MAKLIICCSGRPALNGHKRRTFLWSVKDNCFIHEGRVFDEKELNAVVEAVCKKNYDLRPYVKVAEFSEAVVDASALDMANATIADLQAKLAAVPAVDPLAGAIPLAEANATIESLRRQLAAPQAVVAPTLEEALAIVQAQAPERLRKTSHGRKPATEQTLETGD